MAAASFSKTLPKLRRCVVGGGEIRSSIPNKLLLTSFSSSASAISSSSAESASTSFLQSQEKERGSRWSRWLLFLPGAITFGLGTWQIFRRQEKMKMLEYRQKRLELEPLKFDDIYPLSDKLDSLEFRRVAFKGIFDEKKSICVGPRSRSISGVTENGYYVITPLIPIPGNSESVQSPILVNRGWVPRRWRDKFFEVPKDGKVLSHITPHAVEEHERSSWWRLWSKKPKNIEDQVHTVTPIEVVGVVRGSEKPSMFVPENDPVSGQWFYVDVPAIARAAGLQENTIYVENINGNVNPSNPYPIPKDVKTLICSSVMPQDHLNYTITWYSLSAAVTFMAFKRLKQKKSRR